MKVYSILILGVILFFMGCQKEPLIPEVVNGLEFKCVDGDAESFFEGHMGNEMFCYHDGINGYTKEVSITSGFRTDGPTTSTGINPSEVSDFRVWGNLGFKPEAIGSGNLSGALYPHLQHYVQIETPVDSMNIPLAKLIQDNILAEGELPIRSDIIDNTEGFNIVFRFNDLDEGVSRVFETSGGNQDGSFLRISELEIVEQPFGVKVYDVIFEFTCKLYFDGKGNKFFRKIENARMKLQFEI